jgi:hypothetical protein
MSDLHSKALSGAGEFHEASADAIPSLQMQTRTFPVCAERGDHRFGQAHKHGPEKTLNVGINFLATSFI